MIVRAMHRLGFAWGGLYRDAGIDTMHFEYADPTFAALSRTATLPFLSKAPPKYFFLSETGEGGYYPVGTNLTLHGGVHLLPEPDDAGIRAVMPGYVVAARFAPLATSASRQGANGGAQAGGDGRMLSGFVDGRPLSFVVLRHELKRMEHAPDEKSGAGASKGKKDAKPEAKKKDQPKPIPLYSVYQHIELPRWDKTDDNVGWMQDFVKMQHGGVVDLDPDSASIGETLWAAEPYADGADAFKVRGRSNPVPAKKGERIVALHKPSPKEYGEAIEAFKKGGIVTFGKPLLQVKAGETVGLKTAGSSNYFHWELVAPAKGGMDELSKLARNDAARGSVPPFDLTSLFKTKQEKADSEDNLLDENGEFETVLGGVLPDQLAGPAGESGHSSEQLLQTIFGNPAGYPGRLRAYFRRNDSFVLRPPSTGRQSDAGPQPAPPTATGAGPMLTYPARLLLKNSRGYKGPKGGASTVTVEFKRGNALLGKPLEVKVTSFPGTQSQDLGEGAQPPTVIELEIQIPAQADSMVLSSPDFYLDSQPLPIAFRNRNRIEFFQAMVKARWRNLLLRHMNEWTPAGLRKLLEGLQGMTSLHPLDPLIQQVRQETGKEGGELEELEKRLKPLTWWNRPKTEDDPQGETHILPVGGETSLFGSGAGQLPPDAKIDNLHPVSALWLCQLLDSFELLDFNKEWPRPALSGEDAAKPLLLSWVGPEQPLLGETVHAVLVEAGYRSGGMVHFKAVPEGGGAPLLLAPAVVSDGVAHAAVPAPFWGEWTLSAALVEDQKAGEHDAASEETPVDAQQTPRLTLAVRKPGIVAGPVAVKEILVGKVHAYKATIRVDAGMPAALEGFVYFRCWKARQGATEPDRNTEPTIGKVALKVTASPPPPAPREKGLVVDDKGFVTGCKAKSLHGFSFQSYKKAHATPDHFRIHQELCLRLQKLRASGHKQFPLALSAVAADGLSVTVLAKDRAYAHYAVDKLSDKKRGSQKTRLALLEERSGFTQSSDPSAHTITLSYAPPQDPGGELEFTFDHKPLLGQLVQGAGLTPGEFLFIAPSFIAPNGGHRVLTKDPSVEFDLEELEARCGTEGDGFFKIELEGAMKGPFGVTGFGKESEIVMNAGGFLTEVELFGDMAAWKRAAPIFVVDITGPNGTKQVKDGKIDFKRRRLYADWTLVADKATKRPDRWGYGFAVKIKIQHENMLEAKPMPPSREVKAEPKLLTWGVDPSWNANNAGSVDPGVLALVGTARFIPTNARMTIQCSVEEEQGMRPDTSVKILYGSPADRHEAAGLCDEAGQFLALIPKFCLQDGRKRRFAWGAVEQKIAGKEFTGSITCEYTMREPEPLEETGATGSTGPVDPAAP